MKQKITLLAILFLITILAFGQKPEAKNNEIFWKSKVERQIKGLKKDDIGHRQNHLIQNNKLFSQNSPLKSSQEIKQRLDSTVLQIWDDTTSEWLASSRYEYTYDANWNTTENINYKWDETISQWLEDSKSEYIYDTDNKVTQRLRYSWDETAGQWIVYWKIEYTYDTNGNLAKELWYSWDESTGLWVIKWKWEYTYNTNGKLTQEIDYDWDETFNQWVASVKYEYNYDGNGNILQELRYIWDINTSQWAAFWKFEYTYDTNGNIAQKLHYNWSNSTNQWVPYYKTEYSYENSYSFSDLILPYFYTIYFTRYHNHMLISELTYKWDNASGDWIIGYKDIYYYSEQNIDAVSEINATDLKVYPNPTIDYLNIELSSNMNVSYIEIINMQGMAVKCKEVATNQNTIDVQNLSCGIYIVRIHTDNGIAMKRFIKQ